MYDLGDTATLLADCKNATGVLANAAAAAVTVTLPDGTAAPAQSPANPPATTGKYSHPFVTTQYGLHRYRWTFTGGVPDQVHTDVFNVANSEWPSFVGLTEVKDHLNIPATVTTHDDELRGFILSASEVVESIVGSVGRRTVVETHSGRGRGAIMLRDRPALSITSVLENGVAVTGYSLSDAGVLFRTSGYSGSYWACGVNNVTVTYVAGRVAVPFAVLDGTKELIRINWRPQSGGNYSVFDQGRSDDFGQAAGPGEVRLGFFVPNTVMQRLHPSELGPYVG